MKNNIKMVKGSVLVREDGKKFKAVDVSLWTLVSSNKMLDEEEDRIKFIGKNKYTGFYSKKTYTLTSNVLNND